MSVAAGVTLLGRSHAEALMTSVCTIERFTFTIDPVTLEEVPAAEPVYSGPCKIRFPSTSPLTAGIPGIVVVKDDLILSLPVTTSGGVRVNDVVTIAANSLDPSMVGVRLRVTGAHHQTFATARRFKVEEVS